MCEGDAQGSPLAMPVSSVFRRDGYEAVPGCSGSGTSGWDYCINVGPKALDSSRDGGGGYGMCEGDSTRIPIAITCGSSVFREMDTRLFPGVREARKVVGIIVSMKSISSRLEMVWARTLTACARAIATMIPIVNRV